MFNRQVDATFAYFASSFQNSFGLVGLEQSRLMTDEYTTLKPNIIVYAWILEYDRSAIKCLASIE